MGQFNSHYYPLNDLATILLCFTVFILVKSTYVKNKSNLRLVLASLVLLSLSSISNIFAYALKSHASDNWVAICTLHNVYYISICNVFMLYIHYLLKILNVPYKARKPIYAISIVSYSLAFVLILIQPFTRFGYYFDENFNFLSTLFTPFDAFYIYGIFTSLYLLIKYKREMVPVIRRDIVGVESFAVIVYIFEKFNNDNSIVVLTFLMPIIVIVFLLYSNPFDVDSGALDMVSFQVKMNAIDSPNHYFYLKFYTDNLIMLNDVISKKLKNGWLDYLKKVSLYKLEDDTYVAIIPSNINDVKDIRALIDERFMNYYDDLKVKYKIIVFNDIVFNNFNEFIYAVNYFEPKMNMNSVEFVDNEQYSSVENSQYILSELNNMKELKDYDDERVLVYCQPVKNMSTGKYDSAEALMRLKLDKLGVVYPNEFIPIAEQSGMIHVLSLIILNKVCQNVESLIKNGFYINRVSVNFSMLELNDDNFVSDIFSIIDKYDIPYDKIAFEITESRDDSEHCIVESKVSQLKERGMKFYLDDFGTGYSNLQRTLNLNLDVIKFDRSMLLYACQNENSKFVIEYFAEIFKKLGYMVLFEGVETEEQEDMCILSKADYLQGYLYSKPIPIENLKDFLAKG